MKDDIVITGIGVATALGCNIPSLWRSLLAGKSGITRMNRFAPRARQCAVAAMVDEVPLRELCPLNPVSRVYDLAAHAASNAYVDAVLHADLPRDRIGITLGTGLGMIDVVEQAATQGVTSPASAFRGFHHATVCELLRSLDIQGPHATVSCGCNSGIAAIMHAADALRLDRADVVIAGGAEAELTPGFWSAMSAARALATKWNHAPQQASRPFDRSRDGNVPGEGAAFLVLEKATHAASRGRKAIAKIAGFASRGVGARPAYDPFNPVLDPEPFMRTMRDAITAADLCSNDITTVSANGSSSKYYDALEATAIRGVFGVSPAVHSIKGGLGQTGAVTSALQVAIAALSIQHNIIPPTINCEDQDDACDIDVIKSSPRPASGPILCNAIGFGGHYYDSMVVSGC